MRVLLGGASGLIGSGLYEHLRLSGHEVWKLVRRSPANQNEIQWEPNAGVIPVSQIERFDAIIHMGGSPIAVRWTLKQKEDIVSSRTKSTHLIATTIANLEHPPKVFVCTSAVGYYGDRGSDPLTETAHAGTGFLAETCVAWEHACEPARECGVRTANMRTGIVLAKGGGFLKRLLPIFRFGIGGVIGSGEQHISWIDLTDALRAYTFAIEHAVLSGPTNVTAPSPVTNREFTRAFGRALHRPSFLRVPAFALKLLYGQMAVETILGGQRVLPEKLIRAGFEFHHPTIEETLSSVL